MRSALCALCARCAVCAVRSSLCVLCALRRIDLQVTLLRAKPVTLLRESRCPSQLYCLQSLIDQAPGWVARSRGWLLL